MTICNCDFGQSTRHAVLDRKGRISGYVVSYDDGKWELDGAPFVCDLLSVLLKNKLDVCNRIEQSTQRA